MTASGFSSTGALLSKRFVLTALAFFSLIDFASLAFSQTPSYPKALRGYKVERTIVEIKKPPANDRHNQNDGSTNSDTEVDSLIQLGEPQFARATPLGITFEVPIVVAPVKQSGRVSFLVFEDMSVNGTSVEIDEYHRVFDLPNKEQLTLREPLRFYVYLPRAMIAAVDEWSNSKETWTVRGRVYVFGKFKKGLLTFKRCVPVELNLKMRNPLKEN